MQWTSGRPICSVLKESIRDPGCRSLFSCLCWRQPTLDCFWASSLLNKTERPTWRSWAQSACLFIYLCCLCCSNFLRLSCARFNRTTHWRTCARWSPRPGILNVDEKVAQSARAIPSLLFLDSLHPAGRLPNALNIFSKRSIKPLQLTFSFLYRSILRTFVDRFSNHLEEVSCNWTRQTFRLYCFCTVLHRCSTGCVIRFTSRRWFKKGVMKKELGSNLVYNLEHWVNSRWASSFWSS